MLVNMKDRKLWRTITAYLMQILCYVFLVSILNQSISMIQGNIRITRISRQNNASADIYVSGDNDGNIKIILPEQIYITTDDGISKAAQLGVISIGLLHMIPASLCAVILSFFCFNIARRRVFVTNNFKILIFCSIIMIAYAIVMPLLSIIVIPAIVNMQTVDFMGVGYDITNSIKGGIIGLVFLFLSSVFKYGIDTATHTSNEI